MSISLKKVSFADYFFLFLCAAAVLWVHRTGWVGLRGFVQGDLGLLLNVPKRILNGEIPYRDFYAGNYSPGSYYFHAFLFWIFGEKASVLAWTQGVFCVVSMVLVFLLCRHVGTRTGRFVVTGLSLLLWVPIANIPFPAVYGTCFALATVWLLIKWRTEPHPAMAIGISFLVGLAFSFKISLGIFLGLLVIWVVLLSQHATRWLRLFSLGLVVAGGVLIRERFYVATLLMFLLPLAALAFYAACVFHPPPKKFPARSWCFWIVPACLITLIWVIPFLVVLGPERFYFHFWKFPSLQPKALYYPPAGWGLQDSTLRNLGFFPISQLKDLHKLWFYLPAGLSISTLILLLKNKMETHRQNCLEVFFALNVLLQLQMFPTVDLLHFQWSAAGCLVLLCAAFFGERSRVSKAAQTALALALLLSVALAGQYLHAKKSQGGYVSTEIKRMALQYPQGHVRSLHEIIAFLQTHTTAAAVFWNPPGNLLNFILDRPIHLLSDYYGPNYLTTAERQVWLESLKKAAPDWVVMTQYQETDFGMAAMQRNFPEIFLWLQQAYAQPVLVGEFLVFKKVPHL